MSGPPEQTQGEERSDEALMARVRSGDVDALGVLYDRYSSSVFRMLLYLTGSRSDAEELLQEVFLRVLERRRQWEAGGGDFKTWLYSIARNLAIDAFRRAAIRRSHPELPPSPEPHETEQVELAEELIRLRAALAELERPERELLVLREIEGLPYKKIAAITGESEGTLRSRLFHALRKLRRLLAEG